MKHALLISLTLLFWTVILPAKEYKVKSLEEKKAKVLSSSVIKVETLGENKKTDKTFRLLVVDGGQSTDVSPRYEVQVTYFHGSEGNNTQTAFSLGWFYGFVSTKRISAGIYEVTVKDLSEEKGMQNVTLKINTHQVAVDDAKLRESLEFLDDPYFRSSISVSK